VAKGLLAPLAFAGLPWPGVAIRRSRHQISAWSAISVFLRSTSISDLSPGRQSVLVQLKGVIRMSMMSEFKEFALKGNVMDLAVGVIIGAAFGKIVTSLVDDVIMPVVGWLFGGVEFAEFYHPLSEVPAGTAETLAAVREAGVPVVAYGNFVTILLNFAIMAFIIFQMVRIMNKLKRQEVAAPAAPAAPAEDIVLLREIRDAVRK
jgi:large conductance mechanosensitive channel